MGWDGTSFAPEPDGGCPPSSAADRRWSRRTEPPDVSLAPRLWVQAVHSLPARGRSQGRPAGYGQRESRM